MSGFRVDADEILSYLDDISAIMGHFREASSEIQRLLSQNFYYFPDGNAHNAFQLYDRAMMKVIEVGSMYERSGMLLNAALNQMIEQDIELAKYIDRLQVGGK